MKEEFNRQEKAVLRDFDEANKETRKIVEQIAGKDRLKSDFETNDQNLNRLIAQLASVKKDVDLLITNINYLPHNERTKEYRRKAWQLHKHIANLTGRVKAIESMNAKLGYGNWNHDNLTHNPETGEFYLKTSYRDERVQLGEPVDNLLKALSTLPESPEAQERKRQEQAPFRRRQILGQLKAITGRHSGQDFEGDYESLTRTDKLHRRNFDGTYVVDKEGKPVMDDISRYPKIGNQAGEVETAIQEAIALAAQIEADPKQDADTIDRYEAKLKQIQAKLKKTQSQRSEEHEMAYQIEEDTGDPELAKEYIDQMLATKRALARLYNNVNDLEEAVRVSEDGKVSRSKASGVRSAFDGDAEIVEQHLQQMKKTVARVSPTGRTKENYKNAVRKVKEYEQRLSDMKKKFSNMLRTAAEHEMDYLPTHYQDKVAERAEELYQSDPDHMVKDVVEAGSYQGKQPEHITPTPFSVDRGTSAQTRKVQADRVKRYYRLKAEQEELAKRKQERGSEYEPTWTAGRQDYVQAQQKAVKKALKEDKSVIRAETVRGSKRWEHLAKLSGNTELEQLATHYSELKHAYRIHVNKLRITQDPEAQKEIKKQLKKLAGKINAVLAQIMPLARSIEEGTEAGYYRKRAEDKRKAADSAADAMAQIQAAIPKTDN